MGNFFFFFFFFFNFNFNLYLICELVNLEYSTFFDCMLNMRVKLERYSHYVQFCNGIKIVSDASPIMIWIFTI